MHNRNPLKASLRLGKGRELITRKTCDIVAAASVVIQTNYTIARETYRVRAGMLPLDL